jgi:hypothetical protein
MSPIVQLLQTEVYFKLLKIRRRIMLSYNPKIYRVESKTALWLTNPNDDLQRDLHLLVTKQAQSGKRTRNFLILVTVIGGITSMWVYGPELAATVVDRYQKKSISLHAMRLNQRMVIRSRAILPLVEASENAASQYLQHAPKWQVGVSASFKIVRSVLIVASQSINQYVS